MAQSRFVASNEDLLKEEMKDADSPSSKGTNMDLMYTGIIRIITSFFLVGGIQTMQIQILWVILRDFNPY